ncbi:MAG: hypothetical protein B7Z10_06610 [Rhodobacterales bacterium 32-66-7]|nr:MAG: hypothetical protein B7Z10_06610 [Rhodobacterales bacterium 32-66-7]OZA13638.1 MAG: hypothetical protein B7Y02_05715 [Rhodobacterales bacterium 17-64-5]
MTKGLRAFGGDVKRPLSSSRHGLEFGRDVVDSGIAEGPEAGVSHPRTPVGYLGKQEAQF